MKLQEVMDEVHLAAVEKVARSCALDGSKKRAVEVGNAIIRYGKAWTEAFADDGKISTEEVERIRSEFNALAGGLVPEVDNPAIGIVYNGTDNWFTRLLHLDFKGLKFYFNKWFGLGLE